LRDNKDTIKRNTETLNEAGKGASLEVNVKKIMYMLQNAEQIHEIKIANRSLKMWHS
jgi:hypothetical protein